MPRRPRIDEPGRWHHVMNRGLARRTLFESDADMRVWLALLAQAVRARSIELHAYCLMTTHYHLLVCSVDGALGETMRRVQNLYVRWFNRTRRRDGPLFRGRFLSRPVQTLVYRHAVVSYIDHNPVEARLVTRPADYLHGSARHYAKSEGPIWLTRSWIEHAVQESTRADRYLPESYARVFGSDASEPGRAIVARRLAHGTAPHDPLDHLIDAAPAAVLDWMRRKAKLGDGTRIGMSVCDPAAVRAVILAGRAAGPWTQMARGQHIDAWDQLEVGLLRDLCGLTMREIGASTGRSDNRAARLCRRHREQLADDAEYAARVAEIASRVVRSQVPNRPIFLGR